MLKVPNVVTIKGTLRMAIDTPFKTPKKVPIRHDKIIKNTTGNSGYTVESKDINIPDRAKLGATDKSIALILSLIHI